MNTSTELVLTEEQTQLTLRKPLNELSSFNDMLVISEQLIGSAFVPSHIPDVPTMASILFYGRELGYSPMSAMQNIINISGNLSLKASAMAAAIRKRGIRYTLDKDYEPVYGEVWVNSNDPTKGTRKSDVPTDYITEMTFYEKCDMLDGRIIENKMSITWTDAYKIATDNGRRDLPATYIKYVKNMMVHRLMTRAARLFAPEALAGNVYSPSELILGDSNEEITDARLKQIYDLEDGFEVDGEVYEVHEAEHVSD